MAFVQFPIGPTDSTPRSGVISGLNEASREAADTSGRDSDRRPEETLTGEIRAMLTRAGSRIDTTA